MKPTSTRERVLLICLPAFMVLAVYGWLIYPRQPLEQADVALRAAQAQEPSLTDMAEKQVQIKRLDQQLAEADQRNAELKARRREVMTPRTSGSNQQLTTIQDLTTLMISRNLRLLDQGPVDGKTADLPESLRQAADQLSDKGESKLEPVMWQLQFHGRYRDVLSVVKFLAETDHPAIPIQLLMDEVLTDTDWRAWTLVVWI